MHVKWSIFEGRFGFAIFQGELFNKSQMVHKNVYAAAGPSKIIRPGADCKLFRLISPAVLKDRSRSSASLFLVGHTLSRRYC